MSTDSEEVSQTTGEVQAIQARHGVNPHSVVILDASIHHVEEVSDLIEGQAGANYAIYLPTPLISTLLKVC